MEPNMYIIYIIYILYIYILYIHSVYIYIHCRLAFLTNLRQALSIENCKPVPGLVQLGARPPELELSLTTRPGKLRSCVLLWRSWQFSWSQWQWQLISWPIFAGWHLPGASLWANAPELFLAKGRSQPMCHDGFGPPRCVQLLWITMSLKDKEGVNNTLHYLFKVTQTLHDLPMFQSSTGLAATSPGPTVVLREAHRAGRATYDHVWHFAAWNVAFHCESHTIDIHQTTCLGKENETPSGS